MDVAFLVELHKHTSVMRCRSEPPGRKIAQRKAFYYIRMTDGQCGLSKTDIIKKQCPFYRLREGLWTEQKTSRTPPFLHS